jgi:hypothetical protein
VISIIGYNDSIIFITIYDPNFYFHLDQIEMSSRGNKNRVSNIMQKGERCRGCFLGMTLLRFLFQTFIAQSKMET